MRPYNDVSNQNMPKFASYMEFEVGAHYGDYRTAYNEAVELGIVKMEDIDAHSFEDIDSTVLALLGVILSNPEFNYLGLGFDGQELVEVGETVITQCPEVTDRLMSMLFPIAPVSPRLTVRLLALALNKRTGEPRVGILNSIKVWWRKRHHFLF